MDYYILFKNIVKIQIPLELFYIYAYIFCNNYFLIESQVNYTEKIKFLKITTKSTHFSSINQKPSL